LEQREVDESEFENLKSNKEELGDFLVAGSEKNKKAKKQKNKKQLITDVGFQAPSFRDRDGYRGRGNRGRGRGRGRSNLNVEDKNAFPTLS